MGFKGTNTKKRIIREARKLFAMKGLSGVTMQDICEAAKLSRGGLYRHFGSTEEIFRVMVEEEQAREDAVLAAAREQNLPAKKLMDRFLDSRLRYIRSREENVDTSFKEIANRSDKGHDLLVNYILHTMNTLSEIISLGCEEGTFSCTDPNAVARTILWLIDGMGTYNAIRPLTDEEVAAQKNVIYTCLNMAK